MSNHEGKYLWRTEKYQSLPVLPSQRSILILHFAEEEGSSLPSISMYLIDRVADVIFLPRIALVTLP